MHHHNINRIRGSVAILACLAMAACTGTGTPKPAPITGDELDHGFDVSRYGDHRFARVNGEAVCETSRSTPRGPMLYELETDYRAGVTLVTRLRNAGEDWGPAWKYPNPPGNAFELPISVDNSGRYAFRREPPFQQCQGNNCNFSTYSRTLLVHEIDKADVPDDCVAAIERPGPKHHRVCMGYSGGRYFYYVCH